MANIPPGGEPASFQITPIKFADGQVHMNIRGLKSKILLISQVNILENSVK